MDQLRDYRYTIPGVVFAITFLMGFYHPVEFRFSEANLAKAVAVLTTALIAFSLGYPFALISGSIVSECLLPKLNKVDGPYRGQIVKIGQENHIVKQEVDEEGEKALGKFVSVLHFTLLDQHTVQFMTRRLTNIYVAANSICALISAVILASVWYWKPPYWKYECFEMTLFSAFLLILIIHIRLQYREYKKVIRFFDPLVISKYRKMKQDESSSPNTRLPAPVATLPPT